MKSKAPFMSINPSGSFANTLVASKIRGVNYLSITHKPGGKPSSAQVNRRSQFLLARDAWVALTSYEKAEYNLRARLMPLTGYNLFIKEFSPTMVQTLTKKILSSQLLDLVANPVEIIPAPGVGKVLNIISLFAIKKYNSIGYVVFGADPGFAFPSDLSSYIFSGDFLDLFGSSTDYSFQAVPSGTLQVFVPNQPLMLTNDGVDLSAGDSDIQIIVTYSVEDFLL